MKKLQPEYTIALVLLAGCAVLIAVLLLEALLHRAESAAVRAPLGIDTAIDIAGATDDEEAFTLKAPDEYSEMVERPLFQEGRRPGKASTEDTGMAAQTPFNFKLMGVIVTPRERTALLLDAKNKYKRARANTVVDGWKVVEIRADRVTLRQGDDTRELALLKPKPKVAAPVPNARKAIVRTPDTPDQNVDVPPEDGEPSEEPSAEEEMPADETINE